MSTLGRACAACRKQARKCDRAQPSCRRCVSRGLICPGYPPKFKFCPVVGPKKSTHDRQLAAARGHTLLSSKPTKKKPEQQVVHNSASKKTLIGESDRIVLPSDLTGDPMNLGDTDAGEDSPVEVVDDFQLLLASRNVELSLYYYDKNICPHIMANNLDGRNNPYREFVLPLAYEHKGLLHAVLGLTACHMDVARHKERRYETEALEHRLEAIRFLSIATTGATSGTVLTEDSEQDAILATILILMIHDICDSGISHHGAHLKGAKFVCEQMMKDVKFNPRRRRAVFLLSTLTWFDLVRCFISCEKLAFTQDIRQKVVDASDYRFEMMNGCPQEIFLVMGNVFSIAKQHMEGIITDSTFRQMLDESENELRLWDTDRHIYPTLDPNWKSIAHAYRHACLLRLLRFKNSSQPSDHPDIQSSVAEILDTISEVPMDTELSTLLVLPLTMAGLDCLSPHSRHYIRIRLIGSSDRTGFRNEVTVQLLEKVWAIRAFPDRNHKANSSWTDLMFDSQFERQHDYLIF